MKKSENKAMPQKNTKEIAKKTKILAVGDIHGDIGLIKKIGKKAKKEDVDIIIVAGDLTWFEQSTKNLIGPLMRDNVPILLVPGNHETIPTISFLKEMYPNIKDLHGKHFQTKNLGIFGAGYATNAGPFWVEENKIFGLLKKSHDKIKSLDKKIMVTHMHPKDSKNEFSGWSGSSAVKKAIKEFQPEILITAHIHEASGIEEQTGKTKVINVSRKEKIFEI